MATTVAAIHSRNTVSRIRFLRMQVSITERTDSCGASSDTSISVYGTVRLSTGLRVIIGVDKRTSSLRNSPSTRARAQALRLLLCSPLPRARSAIHPVPEYSKYRCIAQLGLPAIGDGRMLLYRKWRPHPTIFLMRLARLALSLLLTEE
jgi:hypothetical protein